MSDTPPLVLVHGLWDTPRLFSGLQRQLIGRRDPVLIPHLPHKLGATPLEELAVSLGREIQTHFGREQPVDLLGFSMGGVIARVWIQLLGGHQRTRRLISVASPQRGSWVAIPWPRWPLAGIADMKPGSALLRRLDQDLETLACVDCCSFYCPLDLIVVPGWQAVLPLGSRKTLPPMRHDQLMTKPQALEQIAAELLRP